MCFGLLSPTDGLNEIDRQYYAVQTQGQFLGQFSRTNILGT
jgi:hypothetical protein